MLPLRARVNLRAMVSKSYSEYSTKLQHYGSLVIILFNVILRTLFGVSIPSAEIQSVYCTAPADRAREHSLVGGLTPLQRYSQCILQHLQQTGLLFPNDYKTILFCHYLHRLVGWVGGVLWHINPCTLFNVLLSNSDSYICTQLKGFKYCYLTLIILFNITP